MTERRLDPEKLRDAFKRKRYGNGEYDPDFDLFDVAADEIERLREVRDGLANMADALLAKDAEIERLRAALEEIAGDPTGISTYQADLAKQALGRDASLPVPGRKTG